MRRVAAEESHVAKHVGTFRLNQAICKLLYICMYVYIYIFIYVYIYIYTYIYTYIYIYIFTHIYTYIFTHIYVYPSMKHTHANTILRATYVFLMVLRSRTAEMTDATHCLLNVSQFKY